MLMYEKLTHREQNTSRSNKNIEQKGNSKSKKNTASMKNVLETVMRLRRNPKSLTGKDMILLQHSIGNQAVQKLLSEIKEPQAQNTSQKKEVNTENNASKENTYIVKQGDYLSLIAKRFNTTVDELVSLNNIKDKNKIYPGQVIILPKNSDKPTPKDNNNDAKNENGKVDENPVTAGDKEKSENSGDNAVSDKDNNDSDKDEKTEDQTPYADMSRKEKEVVVFGEDREYYKTKSEASKNMVTITIKVWKYDKNGELYSSKASLTINKNLQADVQAIFNEIYESDEKFPIKSVGGYNFRKMAASSSLSHHSYGTAIDINPDENYMIRVKDNKVIAGTLYEPGKNKYSMPADGSVVKAFKKHGWIWGGDWKSSKDYMHFSFLGN